MAQCDNDVPLPAVTSWRSVIAVAVSECRKHGDRDAQSRLSAAHCRATATRNDPDQPLLNRQHMHSQSKAVSGENDHDGGVRRSRAVQALTDRSGEAEA